MKPWKIKTGRWYRRDGEPEWRRVEAIYDLYSTSPHPREHVTFTDRHGVRACTLRNFAAWATEEL